MGLLIPNEIATRWLSEHAIITSILMLYYWYFLSLLRLPKLGIRLGPGYFRAGGLKGHASQHPIGRRLPCHSCSNSVEHPRISQRSYTIQLLQQCGAPTHITTGFHHTPLLFLPRSPCDWYHHIKNTWKFHPPSSLISRAGENINIMVS